MPLSLRLAACGLAGCGCAATATGPLDPRAMGLAQLLGLKISLRAASGSEIGVNRGKSEFHGLQEADIGHFGGFRRSGNRFEMRWICGMGMYPVYI